MNLIKNIEIKNFKSIRHIKIEDCRRVNVFVGYPNVGKSNILEGLGLFSILQLPNREYFKFDDICRVKHFSELFFNQDYRNKSSIAINHNLELNLEIQDRNSLQLEFAGLGNSINRVVEQNEMVVRQPSQREVFSFPNSHNPYLSQYVVKKYSFLNDGFVNNTGPLALSIPYGNNLLEVLQREPELRKDLAEILRGYSLKLLLDTSSGTIMLIKEVDESSVLRIPYHQIADTLKRLIFYKAAVQTNKGSILLFEEPEAHMFPPYISKFTADIMYDKNDNQFFINTHSPFVVNDLMENLKNRELSIYVVGYKKEVGETVVRKLTDKELHDIYQDGIDLYLNLENFLFYEQQ